MESEITPPRIPALPTPAMLILIEDLKRCRSTENEKQVNQLIDAANMNYFDDAKSTKFQTPLVELMTMCDKVAGKLVGIYQNIKDGKYDSPKK